DYVLHHPASVSGAVAAAPPLGRLGVPPPLLLLGRIASRLLPRFALRTGMDLSGLARDPTVIAAVTGDPLFHRWGTARLSTEVVLAIARLQREAPRFTTPLLLLHGGADRMVLPDGTREFVRRAGGDVTLREYPDAYHALFADIGREAPLDDLVRWIEARLPASP
nr:alpha/beta hydrolase [Gemmatimonadales bacterium]